eukprot:3209370-Rhodomonas_salina.2
MGAMSPKVAAMHPQTAALSHGTEAADLQSAEVCVLPLLLEKRIKDTCLSQTMPMKRVASKAVPRAEAHAWLTKSQEHMPMQVLLLESGSSPSALTRTSKMEDRLHRFDACVVPRRVEVVREVGHRHAIAVDEES